MRVLLVHNFYGSENPSGENIAFLAEREMLERKGIEIVLFERRSDAIRASGGAGLIAGGLATPYNLRSAALLRELVQKVKPDVVHVHNTFPLISPSIFRSIHDLPCAVVLTLHNYRLFCAAGMPMREGQVCTECLDKRSVLPALRYGCYRDSRLATIPLAVSIALHRQLGTWDKYVDRFITLTEHQRAMMVHAGLAAELVSVKPQFYPGRPEVTPWGGREAKVVFVGRLSPEKGVKDLVAAWRILGPEAPWLEIIGEGPERTLLENQIRLHGLDRVRLLGHIGFDETQRRIAGARMMIVPSTWFEGFPMVIREAFAYGVPVAASRLGSLAELVKDGVNGRHFEANSPEQIAAVVRDAWSDMPGLERLAEGARQSFLDSYTEEANFSALTAIYAEAGMQRRARGKAVN